MSKKEAEKESERWVAGEPTRESSARVREARADAERALMKLKPHVLYGARVYRTIGDVTPESAWTCSLVYETAPQGGYQIVGLGQPQWAFGLPCATGPSPAAACEAFDKLWNDPGAKDEALESMARVIEEVAAERDNQDAQWGGPEHDDQHDVPDWLGFIAHQVQKASDARRAPGWKEAERRGLVKIAALAVAALESIGRGHGQE